ncbi:MAG TPA: A24 family peptidase [Pirellulales bacterium]|jgi:prepilin signal peptidase PulO-like enzyme (type II secretory pathway)
MNLLALRLVAVFIVGTCLGSFVNWAIYALAWTPRPISPWSRLPPDFVPRRRWDRVPLFGWLSLRRESEIHGRVFWLRPLMLEIGLGLAMALLYWWEVARLSLIQPQTGVLPIVPPTLAVHLQYFSHVVLLCWMLAASFIDIDEKIIPDEITVTGTLLGLLIAAIVPISLLPYASEPLAVPAVGEPLVVANGGFAIGPHGIAQWLEPVTAIAPRAWPPSWGVSRRPISLAIGIGCYWLWCFALAPRIWRGRRGPIVALGLIGTRLWREFRRGPLLWIWLVGTIAITCVWSLSERSWEGLLTALLGLVGSGCLIWAVRLIGTFSLRREAMGFGDVTLMMMIGTFLGWQACLILFFISPLPALVVGIIQFIARRDDVIPFGPFLCMAAATVVVWWAPIWIWAEQFFLIGAAVPIAMGACLVLLGVMLTIWRMIKIALFGSDFGVE